jgi:hypothetical protein
MAKEVEKTQEAKSEAPRKKTLKELFNEPCAVVVNRGFMHQAFQLPGAGTESTLNPGRPGQRDLKLVYHPGYGLIGLLNGKYFLSPGSNVIVTHE